MNRNKARVQQQKGGEKGATTTLPGRSEQGSARDQAGVQDDNSQQQVRQICRFGFLSESQGLVAVFT